jgi:thiol-disulfide isomerase/thioredoxin
MMLARKIPKLLLFFPLWFSCAPQSERDATDSVTGEIALIPVTYAEWLGELKSFRGEIVVVDFWATWCRPCLENFYHLVEMNQQYGEKGVKFVSMCLDDRSDAEAVEAARGFLIDQNARLPNYLMNENIVEAFEKLDLVSIPAVFIYDGDGVMLHRLTGDDPNEQFTAEDVVDVVEELLRRQAVAM